MGDLAHRLWPVYWAIIWYAAALHIVWAVALLVDSSTQGVTAVSVAARMFGWPWTSVFMLTAAAMAIVGIIVPITHCRCNTWFMLPQQFLLILSAGGALSAMVQSKFADGVLRPRAFLIADQLPAILIAVAHVVVMIRMAIITAAVANQQKE